MRSIMVRAHGPGRERRQAGVPVSQQRVFSAGVDGGGCTDMRDATFAGLPVRRSLTSKKDECAKGGHSSSHEKTLKLRLALRPDRVPERASASEM